MCLFQPDTPCFPVKTIMWESHNTSPVSEWVCSGCGRHYNALAVFECPYCQPKNEITVTTAGTEFKKEKKQ